MKKYKEGSKVLAPELKHVWIAHENGEYKYQRYFIESLEDLKKFLAHKQFEHCAKLSHLLVIPWIDRLKGGAQLIVSDNTISGFPSYTLNHESLEILEIINN